MPDFRGLLAALGGGAESLGTDIVQRDQLTLARKRQDQIDALNRLITLQKLGGTEVPAGQDPSTVLQGITNRNDAISGIIPGGTMSAIPNSATGMAEETLPNQFGKPRTVQIPGPNGPVSVVIDPSQTPEALQERRQANQQSSITRREEGKQAAALARQQEGEAAKSTAARTAAVAHARSSFNMLSKFGDPDILKQIGADRLVADGFNEGALSSDPTIPDDYSKAYALAGQLAVQKSAYHAPPMMWEETTSTGPHGRVMLMDKTTGKRMEAPEGTPKQAGGGATAGTTMAMLARLKQVSNDIGSFDAPMSKFEDPSTPINITKVNPLLAAKAAAADATPNLESHGFSGAIGNAAVAATAGLAQQSLTNPLEQAYRNYRTGVKTIGLGLGEINPRPNNALIGIETSLSGADIGPGNPQRTVIIQQRRRNAKKSMDAILGMNPAFVAQMQQQDPNWIDKQIKSAIITGVIPQGPIGGEAAGAKTPDVNDVDAYLKDLRSKKPNP